ncbi:hypothetical protein BGW38_009673, partial [Lunasporangiospora selenospora]
AFDIDYDENPERIQQWHEECNREMEGVDPNDTSQEDPFWTPSNPDKVLSTKLNNSLTVDRLSFLKLLVRMRRVILQDAAMFMSTRKDDPSAVEGQPDQVLTLTNRLITELPHVFQTEMFLTFKSDLQQAINLRQQRVKAIHSNVQVDNGTFISSINALSTSIQGLQAGLNMLINKVGQMDQRLKDSVVLRQEQA